MLTLTAAKNQYTVSHLTVRMLRIKLLPFPSPVWMEMNSNTNLLPMKGL